MSWLLLAVVPVLAGLMFYQPCRRCVRVWCVVDRHRLRACLKQAEIRMMSRGGTLLFLLWVRPTPVGERIWVWLLAGTAASDLDHALEYLASACFTRSARLHRLKKVTTVLGVDLVRRNPLDTSTLGSSPLSRFRKTKTDETSAENVTPINPASTPVDQGTTSASESAESTQSRSRSKAQTTTAAAASGSVIVNGEDLSDYVD